MTKFTTKLPEKNKHIEKLKSFLHIILECQGLDTDIPYETEEELYQFLNEELLDFAVFHQETCKSNLQMSDDMLTLLIQQDHIIRELQNAADIIRAYANPVDNDELLDRALNVLKHEGNCQLDMRQDETSDTGLLMEVDVKFSEENLREALRTAIETYNNELGDHLLNK
jgi:hypothetical protein